MTGRAYYADRIEEFLQRPPDSVLGCLARSAPSLLESSQRDAWRAQIQILHKALKEYGGRGKVYFEYAVPRLGKRIDVLAVIDHVLFVIEFKVGAAQFTTGATDQVWDYALDLKNFHETSHDKHVAPILVATRASSSKPTVATTPQTDGVLLPIHATADGLQEVFRCVLTSCKGKSIEPESWEAGRYSPTPTIIEAAIALYRGHAVTDISRSDSSAINLGSTSQTIAEIIRDSQRFSRKSICFVTGVPGAGKTLVGLNIATRHMDRQSELYSVFLSGNGPLVAILREALARDRVCCEAEAGRRLRKGRALSEAKAFIQNVHHFRDECMTDLSHPPIEHVAIFDEAQRAWNQRQTAKFMRHKRGHGSFVHSEPSFLISCLDRHRDWSVIVCLVGGGQEINTGEAGISEWIQALMTSFTEWRIHISPRLHDREYGAGAVLSALRGRRHVYFNEDLHLGVSMRSFRAEHVSTLVNSLLDLDETESARSLAQISDRYPIVLARDVDQAKAWLRRQARGSERYGMIVSSEAQRLKPHAIDVRSPINPIHWFLNGKDDVRSSYYLEDVATEFQIQGLELDWACVVWDGDFRYADDGWQHYSFIGDRWNRIRKADRQIFLTNAYRVLLTRARQGMVIVVPHGNRTDPTRDPAYYDPTFEYLRRIGLNVI